MGPSASDAPVLTTRCPKSARRQAVSVEIDVPLYSGEGALNSSSYRTDVPKCAPIIAVGSPTSLKILQFEGPPPTITPMRRLGRRERIRTSRAKTSRYGHIYAVGSAGALVEPSVTKMHTALPRAHVLE